MASSESSRQGRTADIVCASEASLACASDLQANPTITKIERDKTHRKTMTQAAAHRSIQPRSAPQKCRPRSTARTTNAESALLLPTHFACCDGYFSPDSDSYGILTSNNTELPAHAFETGCRRWCWRCELAVHVLETGCRAPVLVLVL